jgi:hypothetical protein
MAGNGLVCAYKSRGDTVLLLNDQQPIYSGPCDEWRGHEHGLVVHEGDKLTLIVIQEKKIREFHLDDAVV